MNSVANGKSASARRSGTSLSSRPPATTARRSAQPSMPGTCRETAHARSSWSTATGAGVDDAAIAATLTENAPDSRERCTVRCWGDDAALDTWTATQIAAGRVIGWFQGRMEWGARSAIARIVADPRAPTCATSSTRASKFREASRPFAPSVAEEAIDDFFVGAVPDRSCCGLSIRPDKRSVVAVTHVDGSPAPGGEPPIEPTLLGFDQGIQSASPACRCC